MNIARCAAVALAITLTAPALAQEQQAQDPSATMQALSNVTTAGDFVNLASQSNKFEIDSSNLALTNASSQNVKAFAQMMVDDHTKAGNRLMEVAKAAGMEMTAPQALDARHQAHMDALSKLQGAEFDAQYMALQQQANQEAVTLFTSYSTKGDNEQLKAFAAETLPTLQKHQDMVASMKAN